MVALRSLLILSFSGLFAGYNCENYTYKYYPHYHFCPLISCETKVGWMNDPNGFCIFNNVYHFFYQYNPFSGKVPGIAHWGHAKSSDLVHWTHLPIALFPDQWYDKDGVFSGSALVEDGIMYLYYTGNVNHPNNTPDHEQHQALATSNDGNTFLKYELNPIIIGADLQPNFRDPKVWKHEDTYYMVLGNSFNNDTLGRVLLYTSEDKINWEEVSVLDQSNGFLGYMWECPEFFEIGGLFVLLFSPQGVKPQGYKYRNVYQTGYIVGCFDYENYIFKDNSEFIELDHGHDFYATQTIVNKEREIVVVAWMDMWEQDYPEGADGFTGQLTIPRTLEITHDGRLLQKPIRAIEQAVGRKLYAGKGNSCKKVRLAHNAAKVKIRTSSRRNFMLLIESEYVNDTVIISYDHREGLVSLDRGGHDGVRRTMYRPTGDFHMVIYMDSSSIELFCGDGEVTMSSRFFPTGAVTVGIAQGSYACEFVVNEMIRTVPSPCQEICIKKNCNA